MTKFERAVDKVLKNEGGYVNHPNDPGGETNFGISKRSYPDVDIAALTREQAIEIYRRDWWDKHGFEFVEPAELAEKYFDFAVNMGFAAANKLYLGAVSAPDPLLEIRRLAALRYASLVEKDSKKLVFLRGWLNRVFS